jgi:hypothetical protein
MNVPLHLEYREAIAASRVEISGLIGEYLPFLEYHPPMASGSGRNALSMTTSRGHSSSTGLPGRSPAGMRDAGCMGISSISSPCMSVSAGQKRRK